MNIIEGFAIIAVITWLLVIALVICVCVIIGGVLWCFAKRSCS